mgnify:CR=1 FL=1
MRIPARMKPANTGDTMEKTYHIHTFGCQMNVADSGHVAAELDRLGYLPTDDADQADVVVINTCVVRQSAEEKAIGKLWALKPFKQRRPDMTVALMGCMVGVKPPPELLRRFPHVDVLLPPSDPQPLVDHLRNRLLADDLAALEAAQLARRYQLQDEEWPTAGPIQSVKHLSWHGEAPVAAHVPIVYGCSHACTFCIIPFRRGIERSRPVREIVDEVRGLVAQGVREVTLLGQIVDRYGYDWRGQGGQLDLADLLYAVHEVEGLHRIRFLTSHPNYMSDRILEAVRDLPKVCEHIEVPCQAGNDQILAQMKRGYTTDDYRALIARIRERIPHVAIHTDVIVGFPGETTAQFQDTYDLLAELQLDKVHLARYSPRPGTVSARRMVDDVPEVDKHRRLHDLEDLQEAVQAGINRRLLGETVEVLVEDRHKGKWRGRTRTNKLVFFDDVADRRGQLVDVRITWASAYSMQGELATSPAAALPFRMEIPLA